MHLVWTFRLYHLPCSREVVSIFVHLSGRGVAFLVSQSSFLSLDRIFSNRWKGFLTCVIFRRFFVSFFLLLADELRKSPCPGAWFPFSSDGFVSLPWIPGFTHMVHTPSFHSSFPLLSPLLSSSDSLFCPVRACHIYLDRSYSWLAGLHIAPKHDFFWSSPRRSCHVSKTGLSTFFTDAVADSRVGLRVPTSCKIGSHQISVCCFFLC